MRKFAGKVEAYFKGIAEAGIAHLAGMTLVISAETAWRFLGHVTAAAITFWGKG